MSENTRLVRINDRNVKMIERLADRFPFANKTFQSKVDLAVQVGLEQIAKWLVFGEAKKQEGSKSGKNGEISKEATSPLSQNGQR